MVAVKCIDICNMYVWLLWLLQLTVFVVEGLEVMSELFL